ncbi:MAG TPA: trypsin-like peptidase domain-containing protein [Candidatus Kapabacteria bacterium]|nr:trypsin-like peptidase domain-containing protein [Candidatus Kapabacteria bacterium]
MKKILMVTLAIVMAVVLSTSLSAKVKVGELVNEKFEVQPVAMGAKGVITEKIFFWPNAGYISIHFSKFDLVPGDYVEISSPDGRYFYTYREKGKYISPELPPMSEFWATHIPGDTAILRFIAAGQGGSRFTIDQWARGFENEAIDAYITDMESDSDIEAICSVDDKKWAKCYDGTEMYNKSKAVCRLLIGGTSACTGWLLGSEGHVMTNNHCITTQTDAGNTDYEFMAEGATCATSCSSWGACPGNVAATAGTLIKTNAPMDYTLVKLPTNVSLTYGYLQLRNTTAIIGERIYIPQHPGAYGKQLAVESDADGGFAKVYSLNQPACQVGGPNDVGYYADTAGGSSGSPVLAYNDNLVVSLHHCATCPNRGVPIPPIINDLGALLPANAIGGAPVNPPADPGNLVATAASCSQINLSWSDNSTDETQFNIERGTDGVNFSQIATVGANVTNYSNTGLTASTTYYYRVRAYNNGGYSGYTNTANAATPVCPPAPPAAPSNLAGTASQTSIALTWTDNSNNEDGFKIYRGLSSSNLSLIATVGSNVTSYNDTGLARRTTYYYKVCAYNANGESCSGIISKKTK